jgi:hypothetical protein
MSREPSNSDWLEQALESARRNVRQIEIDACRLRTDLAQLEVANAAVVVDDRLVARLRDSESVSPSTPSQCAIASATAPEVARTDHPPRIGAPDNALDWQPATVPAPVGMELLIGAPTPTEGPFQETNPPTPDEAPIAAELSPVSGLINRSRAMYRRATSPMVASLIVHSAIILLAMTITVATIERTNWSSTVLDLNNETPKVTDEIDVQQLADLGDMGAEDEVSTLGGFEAVGSLDQDPIPLEFDSVDGPASLGRIGSPGPLEADIGSLMAGLGGLSADGTGAPTGLGAGNQRGRGGSGRGSGDGRKGGRVESTFFFGTQAVGDRFVFVVDNSNSMKDGRLEMAVAELARTIDSLSPRQSFYVIFVSDKVYPMFYPQREPGLVPATPENKKRLADWAPKAILASGKNRELIAAMDMAASLQPQAVYLLWDGDLRYSDKVRTDVMTHLTQPNGSWNFIIHTLGMGITSLDSEQNLTAIAQAHRGVYRRINVPTTRAR